MKKIITVLLLCSLLLAALAGCGTQKNDSIISKETTTVLGTETSFDDKTGKETDRPPLSLQEKDYGGYNFKVLGYKKGNVGTWGQYLDFGWSKDDSGELINDAIYSRNLEVEEEYNIKVETIETTDVYKMAHKSINAGADEYDIIEPYIDMAVILAQDGLLIDFHKIPYVNISQPWWDQAILSELSLCGKTYTMSGDISVYDEELNFGLYYNKTVAKQYDIEDCYALARDGKWTVDKMTEFGHSVTHDLNGDGMLGEDDMYGVLTDYSIASIWFFALGGRMSELDANGKPELVISNEKGTESIEAVSKFMTDKNLTLNASETKRQWTTLDDMLKSDRALFRPGCIYDIALYRSMISDFGILPYPKLDENQEQYCHFIATWACPGISVPITSSDIDRTGIILEALAYASHDTVTKAYYDVNLYTKIARDEESGEMLDIIFATKHYDLARTFGWGGLDMVLQNSAKDSGKFASLYATAESKAKTEMDNSYNIFSAGN